MPNNILQLVRSYVKISPFTISPNEAAYYGTQQAQQLAQQQDTNNGYPRHAGSPQSPWRSPQPLSIVPPWQPQRASPGLSYAPLYPGSPPITAQSSGMHTLTQFFENTPRTVDSAIYAPSQSPGFGATQHRGYVQPLSPQSPAQQWQGPGSDTTHQPYTGGHGQLSPQGPAQQRQLQGFAPPIPPSSQPPWPYPPPTPIQQQPRAPRPSSSEHPQRHSRASSVPGFPAATQPQRSHPPPDDPTQPFVPPESDQAPLPRPWPTDAMLEKREHLESWFDSYHETLNILRILKIPEPRNREKFGIGKRPEPMSFIEYFAAKQLPLAMATHLDIQAWFDKEAQAFRKKPEFNFPQPQKDWIRCAWDLLLASPTRFGNYRQLRRAANLEAIALYDCPWCADMNPEDQERIQTPLARRIWDARLVFDDTLIDVGVISGPWPISKEEEAKMRKRREEDAERRRRHESRVGDN